MNRILYVNKTGCQWRMTPKDFPPHNIVFYYFTKWKREGVFEERQDQPARRRGSRHRRQQERVPRLKKIITDGGYRGDELKEKVQRTLGCKLEVALRPDESQKKFNVITLRWIVERSFAWLYNFRRITLDYEFYSESSVTMIQIAFAKIMLNKLSH